MSQASSAGPGAADRPPGRSRFPVGPVLRIAAVLLALLVAGISIHLLVLSQQETTEEKIRGPAVVRGCDIRGSRVVVTAEVFNDREYPVTHSMVYWAEDASGVRLTKLGEPHVSIPLQPGQHATVSGTAELSEGVDEAKVAGCQVSVR